jgi:hypothetical protein
MDAIALHLEVRNALSLSDELGRHEHELGNDRLAGHLAALRTSLDQLERKLGRSHVEQIVPSPLLIESISRQLDHLRDSADELPDVLRPRLGQLLSALERVVFAELRPNTSVPAKPLFGKLPIKRVIPQDVHSVMDYLSAAAYFASAGLARTRRGRAMGLLLGANVAGVSLVTDYRLSVAKVIPIELHELLDHTTGATAVTAPLVLGYIKRDPIAAAIQIFTGLSAIAASLFTDYRACKGVGRALRSRGGPRARRPGDKKARVQEVQRPLEGFAGPSYIPEVPL